MNRQTLMLRRLGIDTYSVIYIRLRGGRGGAGGRRHPSR